MTSRQRDRRHDGDGVAERTLPHNLEAEQSVLGAILVHNDAFDIAREALSGTDFYRDAHRRLYEAMTHLIDQRKVVVDFVTLKEELARRGELDEVGGPAYISSLADGVPRSTNVKHYAEIVHEKARLRDIIYAANKALSSAYEGAEASEAILRRTDAAFLTLAQQRGGGLTLLSATSKARFERIEWRTEHRGEITGVPTGHSELDALTLGWQPKEITVVGAFSSMGKTTWLANTILAAARRGVTCAVFSFETRQDSLEDKLLAIISGVDAHRIRSGQIGALDHAPLAHALEELDGLKIAIDDARGQTIQDLRVKARRLQSEYGLGLMAVDYIQLMRASVVRKEGNRNEELSEISDGLHDLSMELNVPIIVLSQLTGDSKERPNLGSLRDSKTIGNVAGAVGLIHREDHRRGGVTEFIVVKQRNGPTGTVYYDFERDTQRMTETVEPVSIPSEQPAPKRRRSRKPAWMRSGVDKQPELT